MKKLLVIKKDAKVFRLFCLKNRKKYNENYVLKNKYKTKDLKFDLKSLFPLNVLKIVSRKRPNDQ